MVNFCVELLSIILNRCYVVKFITLCDSYIIFQFITHPVKLYQGVKCREAKSAGLKRRGVNVAR